jgi:hypothetical protein
MSRVVFLVILLCMTLSYAVIRPELFPSHESDTATADPGTSANDEVAIGSIAELLSQVSVVDEIPDITGYQRGCGKGQGCVFGPAWNDPLDHSGCDTRFLGGFSVL